MVGYLNRHLNKIMISGKSVNITIVVGDDCSRVTERIWTSMLLGHMHACIDCYRI